MRAVFCSAVMMFSCSAAWAQTAEETIAFIMYQVEANKEFPSSIPGKNIKAIQESSSPADYYLIDPAMGTDERSRISVTKLDGCKYEISSFIDKNRSKSQLINVTSDFTTATQVSRINISGDPTWVVQASDSCAFKIRYQENEKSRRSDEKCSSFLPLTQLLKPETDRVQKAFAHLKANFCKGRAF